MSFLKELKSWLGLSSESTPDSSVSEANPLFVYIKLPVDLQPLERGELFEDPIQEALERERVGAVTGGGSQFTAPDENGRRHIDFCGIDVDLYDPAKGLALLRRELVRLNAPPGTVLLYELNGQELEEPIYPTSVH